MTKLRLLYIFIFIIFTSCTTQNTPKNLVFGLKSYMTLQEVKIILNKENSKWNIIDHTKLKENDPRPKYEFLTLETTIFKDNGFSGKTELVFYNNRLMSIIFFPASWENYKIFLKENKKIQLDKNEEWSFNRGGINMLIRKDFKDRAYFKWEDVTLKNEMTAWIMKYS